jgi:hypothetical protein
VPVCIDDASRIAVTGNRDEPTKTRDVSPLHEYPGGVGIIEEPPPEERGPVVDRRIKDFEPWRAQLRLVAKLRSRPSGGTRDARKQDVRKTRATWPERILPAVIDTSFAMQISTGRRQSQGAERI